MSHATYRTRDGDTLDYICYLHYGQQSGAVEQVLDYNPGLAALGPVYPENILINLPQLTQKSESKVLRLWD